MPRKHRRQRHIRGKPLLSEYAGVTLERGKYRRKPWKAYAISDGRQINLGRYAEEGMANAAVQAYRETAPCALTSSI